MNKYILSLLLLTCIPSHASAAKGSAHHQSSHSQTNTCSNPQQPARLQCASAVSSQFDNQGKLWVVWSYAGHNYVTSSVDAGKTFNQSYVVNKVPEKISAHGENRPKLAVSTKGKIYISWTTPLAKRYTGHVRFSSSTDGGKNFSDPITVNDNLDITGHRFESMSVNQQGTIFLAWLDKRDQFDANQKGANYNGAALYYSYSTDGGKSFKKNQNIKPHTCECCRVAMAIDHDQLPVIVWRNIYGKNTRDHSLVKMTQNEIPGKIKRVSNDNWKTDACPHHGPAISISQPDISMPTDYHLVWFNNAPERHGIFYRRMNNTMSENATLTNLGDYAKGASHPDVLGVGQQVWVVWKQFDGEYESIWMQQSQDRGETWTKAAQMAATKSRADYPFLINHEEKVYLQWQTAETGYQLLPIN